MAYNHSSRAHALLSASGASRWLNCTPSPRLEEQYGSNESSDYADEGTLAHEFADIALRLFNHEITQKQYDIRAAKLRKNKHYKWDMDGFVNEYVTYVKDKFFDYRFDSSITILSVEERLDYSEYVQEGFGTGDAVIISDECLHVIDLKYGQGVAVSAINNDQLKLYGLGAYLAYSMLYNIKEVVVTIVQPRMDSITTEKISVDDLLSWADYVEERAKLAWAGKGEQVAGDWCRWCKIKATCVAFSGQKYKTAVEDFKLAKPAVMSEAQLLEIYGQIKDLKAWIKAVDDYVKSEARSGRRFPGYKLVKATAKRKWLHEQDTIDALEGFGFDIKDITNTKIKGILDIEQLVSKDFFLNKLGHLVVKPQGAPTLVPESDPRDELGGTESAIKDFL